MNIASTTSTQAAAAAVSSGQPMEINTAVLKKSLDLQASNAATLLQALPQPAALATSGNLGTHVNTFA